MSVVCSSESNIVKAIICKTEVREDNKYVISVWLHLIIIHNNINH